MLLTGADAIRDVILFPTLRPAEAPTQAAPGSAEAAALELEVGAAAGVTASTAAPIDRRRPVRRARPLPARPACSPG